MIEAELNTGEAEEALLAAESPGDGEFIDAPSEYAADNDGEAESITPPDEPLTDTVPPEDEANEADIETIIHGAVEELGRIDPSIRTVDDLLTSPCLSKTIYYYSEKGYSLGDAYRLASYERMTAEHAISTRLNTLRQTKSHLRPVSGNPGRHVSVPADVMAQYLVFNPRAGREEIERHYSENRDI